MSIYKDAIDHFANHWSRPEGMALSLKLGKAWYEEAMAEPGVTHEKALGLIIARAVVIGCATMAAISKGEIPSAEDIASGELH